SLLSLRRCSAVAEPVGGNAATVLHDCQPACSWHVLELAEAQPDRLLLPLRARRASNSFSLTRTPPTRKLRPPGPAAAATNRGFWTGALAAGVTPSQTLHKALQRRASATPRCRLLAGVRPPALGFVIFALHESEQEAPLNEQGSHSTARLSRSRC